MRQVFESRGPFYTSRQNSDILKEDPGFVQSFPTGETPHRDSATPHEVGDLIQL